MKSALSAFIRVPLKGGIVYMRPQKNYSFTDRPVNNATDYFRLRGVVLGLGLVAMRCAGFALNIFRITASNGTRSSAYSERSTGFACLAGVVMVGV